MTKVSCIVKLSSSESTRMLLLASRSHSSLAGVSTRYSLCGSNLIRANPASVTGAAQCMGTWTDRLRRRWQSGSNPYEQDVKVTSELSTCTKHVQIYIKYTSIICYCHRKKPRIILRLKNQRNLVICLLKMEVNFLRIQRQSHPRL